MEHGAMNTCPSPNSSATPSQLRVAVVQMSCQLGDRPANLARAEGMLEEAGGQGAQLVLLPELAPGGYTLTEALWDTAEPFDGPTTQWLRKTCSRLQMYVGTTFLEADGEDFYNCFVLMGPDGKVVGRVRKNPPASFEAWYFRAGSDPHWFDTPLGRIGVGICFENALYERYLELHAADIDLLLRPFSGASFEARWPIRQRDVEIVNAALRDGTEESARAWGIPVLMANKVGRLVTTLPMGFPKQNVEFPGFSAVADGNGKVLGQLRSGTEGVIVGNVTLNSASKRRELRPNDWGRWTTPMPWWAGIWVMTQKLGERAYARSEKRRARARAMSNGSLALATSASTNRHLHPAP